MKFTSYWDIKKYKKEDRSTAIFYIFMLWLILIGVHLVWYNPLLIERFISIISALFITFIIYPYFLKTAQINRGIKKERINQESENIINKKLIRKEKMENKNENNLLQMIGSIYGIGSIISLIYFEYLYAVNNGFIEWLFLGFIVPAFQALVWPIYFINYFI